MAQHDELYRAARYYDVVFNRNIDPQIDFLHEVYRDLRGREPASLLDLACGPGYHAREWVRRGGRAVGLDLRPEMVEFARDGARAQGVAVDWLVGDMRGFALAEPVDVALAAFDSLDCLQTNDDLVAHLRAVARNLTPSGLYVIDRTHPRDCSPTAYGDWHYQGERDGCSVRIDWAVNEPVFDHLTGTFDVEVHMHVEEDGRRETIVSRATERLLTAQEIVALARLSGAFGVRCWYGAWDTHQPFDGSPAADRMVAVLERVESDAAM